MQRGFSLVETIIATSLLAVALVTLAQFVGVSMHTGAAARARTVTTQMAEQKMEQLRVRPWTVIASMPAAATDYLDAAGNERCGQASVPCGEAVYVRRWSASSAAFSSGVLIIEVDVRPVGHGHGSTALVTARAKLAP